MRTISASIEKSIKDSRCIQTIADFRSEVQYEFAEFEADKDEKQESEQ